MVGEKTYGGCVVVVAELASPPSEDFAGTTACLNNVDKKFKSHIALPTTFRFQVFENRQIMAG